VARSSLSVAARSRARSLALENAYDNLAAMLRAERPEVVHVCSPNFLHGAHAHAILIYIVLGSSEFLYLGGRHGKGQGH